MRNKSDVEQVFNVFARTMGRTGIRNGSLVLESLGRRYRIVEIGADGSRTYPLGSRERAAGDMYDVLWFATDAVRLSRIFQMEDSAK